MIRRAASFATAMKTPMAIRLHEMFDGIGTVVSKSLASTIFSSCLLLPIAGYACHEILTAACSCSQYIKRSYESDDNPVFPCCDDSHGPVVNLGDKISSYDQKHVVIVFLTTNFMNVAAGIIKIAATC